MPLSDDEQKQAKLSVLDLMRRDADRAVMGMHPDMQGPQLPSESQAPEQEQLAGEFLSGVAGSVAPVKGAATAAAAQLAEREAAPAVSQFGKVIRNTSEPFTSTSTFERLKNALQKKSGPTVAEGYGSVRTADGQPFSTKYPGKKG